jgi:hypothetical protein
MLVVREGVYQFVHEKGYLIVSLRAYGVFQCEQYVTKSSWGITSNDSLFVDFGEYGKYELFPVVDAEDPDSVEYEGHVVDQPRMWRKLVWVRPFTEFELLLYSGGTGWHLTCPVGVSFEVEFRADSENHFMCDKLPPMGPPSPVKTVPKTAAPKVYTRDVESIITALPPQHTYHTFKPGPGGPANPTGARPKMLPFSSDHHWKFNPFNNQLDLDWGQYGEFHFTIEFSEAENTYVLTGCKKGQPHNWRRLFLMYVMGAEGTRL